MNHFNINSLDDDDICYTDSKDLNGYDHKDNDLKKINDHKDFNNDHKDFIEKSKKDKISVISFHDYIKTECTLGKGGFGIVNAAFYKTLDIAVKTLSVLPEEAKEGILLEIQINKRIKSSKIPILYGKAIDKDKNLCLIIERIKGFDLAKVISSFSLKTEIKYCNMPNFNHYTYQNNLINQSNTYSNFQGFDLNDLMRIKFSIDMADALVYIHKNDIIHRDLKPSNYIIDINSMTVKLLDFGISKLILNDESVINSKPREGTLLYYSPENCDTSFKKDEPCVVTSKKSDIFSFGLVLNEFFSGDYPWKNRIKKSHPFPVLTILNNPKEKFDPSENIKISEIVKIIKHCTIFDKNIRYSSKELYHHLIFCLYLELSGQGNGIKEYLKILVLYNSEISGKSSKIFI